MWSYAQVSNIICKYPGSRSNIKFLFGVDSNVRLDQRTTDSG